MSSMMLMSLLRTEVGHPFGSTGSSWPAPRFNGMFICSYVASDLGCLTECMNYRKQNKCEK